MINVFLPIKCVLTFLVLLTTSASASPTVVGNTGETPPLFQLFADDAEPVISEALAKQGAGEKVAATVYGQDASKPLLAHNKPIEVEIHGLRFDEETKRWTASMMAVHGQDVVTAIPIGGRYEEVVTLPVLRRQLRSGDTIAEDDIEMQDFAVSRVRGEVVTTAEALVGQTPVRTLSSSRPIRTHEISGPIVVSKKSLVKIRYTMPGIEISDTGEAMEDGSEGSLIPVRNVASKKIIYAVVNADGSVQIPTKSAKKAQNETKGLNHATN
ncbi:MAG: flagellar basal body P-ring formation chaperone FlgA [Alphaproteobacteria bacterium]